MDINPKTFNIDPSLIEEKVTPPRTKTILAVYLYGQATDMNLIMELAEKYELQVLEDVSPAFKREYKGRKFGTIGHGRAFVFFPSKNWVYGEGGLIATNDDQVAEAARMLRAHGGKNYNEMLGYNLRLDALQAAILRVKFSRIDKWSEARRKVGRTYNELLEDGSGMVTLYEVSYARHVYHQYVIMRVQNERHDEVRRGLAEGLSMIYYPMQVYKQSSMC